LVLEHVHEDVLRVLEQAEFLQQRYGVVVANPPYMGGKGMNTRMAAWAKDNYPDSKSDLFAMFMERGFELVPKHGYSAMVTMQSWMFLSSYEKLRTDLLNNVTIDCMVHMGNMVMGIAFGTAATVWNKCAKPDYHGHFSYVDNADLDEKNIPKQFPIQNDRLKTACASDFKKVPSSPIAYWMSQSMRGLFEKMPAISDVINVTGGMTTANNDRFLRKWYEVSNYKTYLNAKNREDAKESMKKWFPYNKGGEYRKWFGNNEHVVNWFNDGEEIIATGRAFPRSKDFYFLESLTYTATSSSYFGIRYSDSGFIFDAKGSSCFSKNTVLVMVK